MLAGLRAIGRRLRATAPAAAERIDAEVEQFESAAHELAELRLVHLVMAGMVRLSPDEVTEVRRVIGPGDSAARLGLGSTPEPGRKHSLIVYNGVGAPRPRCRSSTRPGARPATS